MVYKTMNNFFNLPSVGELKDKIERRGELKELFGSWMNNRRNIWIDVPV